MSVEISPDIVPLQTLKFYSSSRFFCEVCRTGGYAAAAAWFASLDQFRPRLGSSSRPWSGIFRAWHAWGAAQSGVRAPPARPAAPALQLARRLPGPAWPSTFDFPCTQGNGMHPERLTVRVRTGECLVARNQAAALWPFPPPLSRRLRRDPYKPGRRRRIRWSWNARRRHSDARTQ